jgi:HAE1 family hydrophobic/amphiphilic exporter-1
VVAGVLAVIFAIFGTFAAIYFLGFTLNLFTLLAMSLSVGLVVDDATDVAALASAIASLGDPARRVEMGARARRTALRYPWEGPLRATQEVLQYDD